MHECNGCASCLRRDRVGRVKRLLDAIPLTEYPTTRRILENVIDSKYLSEDEVNRAIKELSGGK